MMHSTAHRHGTHAFRYQTHLAGAGRTPVRHWIEIVDEALTPAASNEP
jgi:hypothetical protein